MNIFLLNKFMAIIFLKGLHLFELILELFLAVLICSWEIRLQGCALSKSIIY